MAQALLHSFSYNLLVYNTYYSHPFEDLNSFGCEKDTKYHLLGVKKFLELVSHYNWQGSELSFNYTIYAI